MGSHHGFLSDELKSLSDLCEELGAKQGTTAGVQIHLQGIVTTTQRNSWKRYTLHTTAIFLFPSPVWDMVKLITRANVWVILIEVYCYHGTVVYEMT